MTTEYAVPKMIFMQLMVMFQAFYIRDLIPEFLPCIKRQLYILVCFVSSQYSRCMVMIHFCRFSILYIDICAKLYYHYLACQHISLQIKKQPQLNIGLHYKHL